MGCGEFFATDILECKGITNFLMSNMKDEDLYHYYQQREENEETSQEYLTRMLYMRNFDTPKKLKEIKDEIDILRSAVETLAEREKTRRMGSVGATSSERE